MIGDGSADGKAGNGPEGGIERLSDALHRHGGFFMKGSVGPHCLDLPNVDAMAIGNSDAVFECPVPPSLLVTIDMCVFIIAR